SAVPAGSRGRDRSHERTPTRGAEPPRSRSTNTVAPPPSRGAFASPWFAKAPLSRPGTAGSGCRDRALASPARRRRRRAASAEAVGLHVEDEHPGRDPGAGAGTEADAGGAGVEVGVRGLGEAGALEPDPALGVLGPPVVADHSRPTAQLERFVVDHEPPLEAG